MKKFLTAAVALSIVASAGVASAQGPQRPDQHQQQGYNDRDRHDNDRHDQRPGDNNSNNYERHAPKRYKAPSRYQPPRGYQANHQWRHGERLPASYRSKGYVVDYRHYGLSAPPRGYQYVRVDNDVVLAAVTTGVISSVIYQLFQ